jgi:flagellin-like protein
MKANKKFREGEEAVSAVIGVILMVAITVAIAATVYVYVSGMIGGGPATAFPNIVLKDDVAICGGVGDDLFTIEHRAGSSIDWDNYDITVKDDTGATLDWATEIISDAGSPPAGSFKVTDIMLISEEAATDIVTVAGMTVEVQIVDKTQQSIVYENTVFVE